MALAAGLLVGGAGMSAAEPATVTIDRPNPKERPTPGDRPDPRCDRAEQGLAIAKANVAKARQRLKAAPKKKKPARRSALRSAKQTRISAKARAARYC
jgi:ribosomal protein L15E